MRITYFCIKVEGSEYKVPCRRMGTHHLIAIKNKIFLDFNIYRDYFPSLSNENSVIMNFLCRYLIVVDDLWEASDWTDISIVLPENNLGSIIMTTTRKEYVANACCSSYNLGDFVHKVESMNDLDSKTLFLGRIFGSENNCPHDFEEMSLKILKKCAG